jgi:uncharacterized membrane protein YhaH (DUF805 family)
MVESIRYNLTNLARFSGRESRALFWPYAIAVIILGMLSMFALMVPGIMESFGRMQRFAAAHPDQATVDSGPGHYSITIHGSHPELMPDMSSLSSGVGLIALIVAALLAAAVARRLHDRRMRGVWGLLPLPFLGFGLIMMPRFFESVRTGHPPDMQLFMAIFFNNFIYILMLATLVVLLVGEGTRGPNRFGEQPV